LEQRLVGQWMRPDEPTAMLHTFSTNRRYTCDNEFIGSWSISDGQLHLRYWSKDPPQWYRRLTPDDDEVHMDIKFDDASNRVELKEPSDAESTILQRKTEP
jgi:hypothetical protein